MKKNIKNLTKKFKLKYKDIKIFNNDEILLMDYYKKNAIYYDNIHLTNGIEHKLSMHILYGILDFLSINSILEVGSGTGSFLKFIKNKKPNLKIKGIDPSEDLRNIAYSKGISRDELIDGNGYNINFKDNSFDCVCAFGVLHHVKHPRIVISEMMRVAKKVIFISDSNNFGQNNYLIKKMKQIFNFLGLWPLVNFLKTKCRGYHFSEGDGIYYSYSIFNDIDFIQKKFEVHIMNIDKNKLKKGNLYFSSSHIALLGIKK